MFKLIDLANCSGIAASICLALSGPAAAGVVQIEQISQRSAAVASVDQAPPTWLASEVADAALPVSLLLRNDAPGARALVDQTGAGAYSLIVQENSRGGLYAEVHQTAPGARSLILQSGEMNTALVYQTSAGAYSSIVQSGFGNMAMVSQ